MTSFKSKLPAVLCRTKTCWEQFAFDFWFWRRVPKSEYDRWVDRCEALDKRIQFVVGRNAHLIGEITYWRERAVEITLSELSDKRLLGLQQLFKGRFRVSY
jgi:hypothetical protein